MALLNAGHGAARLLLGRAVPAALTHPPPLRPRFDPPLVTRTKPRPLWEQCQDATLEPKVRPVLPLETRHDADKEVIVLCRSGRGYLIQHAAGATGLLHSDLNKYWVEESLREIYTSILKQRRATVDANENEFGKNMDATVQTFQRLGSSLVYELGTCCVTDMDGVMSVVVDEGFFGAFRSVLPYNPALLQPTGYALWSVAKAAFQCGAFKVERSKTMVWDMEYVVPDEEKFKLEEDVKKAGDVKTAVEIDRSVLGKGRLLFFMPPESAWNKFEVFAEMCKAGYDMKGLELELSQLGILSDRLKHGVWYTIRRLDRQCVTEEGSAALPVSAVLVLSH